MLAIFLVPYRGNDRYTATIVTERCKSVIFITSSNCEPVREIVNNLVCIVYPAYTLQKSEKQTLDFCQRLSSENMNTIQTMMETYAEEALAGENEQASEL